MPDDQIPLAILLFDEQRIPDNFYQRINENTFVSIPFYPNSPEETIPDEVDFDNPSVFKTDQLPLH